MGNSKSTTVIKPNTTVPLKSALKKSAVPGPVSTYNYYPNPYTPVQYIYLPHPVGSNENYPPNQFYPPSQMINNIPEQRFPSHHHYQHSHTLHDHHHHHHRHPHHHHRHHHRSQSRIEQERATLPSPTPSLPSVKTPKSIPSIVAYKLMSPVPTKESIPPLPPSAQTPKRIPSVVTYKIMSPVPTKEFITPPPPPPPPPAPSSFIIVKQDETPSSRISKSTIPSLLTSSNRFEKAPSVAINYVSKSPDNHSIHNYEPELLTVVQRSSSRHATSGNRWYDHDYDKRVKSFTFNNVESN